MEIACIRRRHLNGPGRELPSDLKLDECTDTSDERERCFYTITIF
eukprot:COSAG05_NODE_19095_length_297_cov_1.575758_1_plen_44_part_10